MARKRTGDAPGTCLDRQGAAFYVFDTLEQAKRIEVETHLGTCARCRRLVDDLSSDKLLWDEAKAEDQALRDLEYTFHELEDLVLYRDLKWSARIRSAPPLLRAGTSDGRGLGMLVLLLAQAKVGSELDVAVDQCVRGVIRPAKTKFAIWPDRVLLQEATGKAEIPAVVFPATVEIDFSQMPRDFERIAVPACWASRSELQRVRRMATLPSERLAEKSFRQARRGDLRARVEVAKWAAGHLADVLPETAGRVCMYEVGEALRAASIFLAFKKALSSKAVTSSPCARANRPKPTATFEQLVASVFAPSGQRADQRITPPE